MRKLLLFSLPFGAGTLLCQYLLPGSLLAWTAAALLLTGLGASFLLTGRRRRVLRIASVGLAAGVLWFSGYAALYLEPAEELVGTVELVTVEILDYPEASDFGVRCPVRVLDRGLRGRALLYGTSNLLSLEPGNRVVTEAKYYSAAALAGGESTYYTSQGIFLRLYARGEALVEPGTAGSLRFLPQRMAKGLRDASAALYEQPTAGLITALLTGERGSLDARSERDLSESGLSHIVAISGLHCGFLITLLGALVLRRQRLTALLGYPVLLVYMCLAGCTPSVVRACVMVGFALLAPLAGREGDAPTSLAGALLVILLANPFAIASVSLQLSFAAVAGLLLIAPRIFTVFRGRRPRLGRVLGGIWNFLAATISASLGVMVLTAPLSAVYFGYLSLVSPLSNLLVLWMAPVLFACALLVTAGSLLCPALAVLAAAPDLLARYVLGAAAFTAELPGHGVRFTGPAVVLWMVLVYTFLAICALSRDRRRKYLFAGVLAAVCLMAAKALPPLSLRGSQLTIVAVDVGQGAATLLHAGDVTALVDCGSLSGDAGSAVASTMDTYGWDRLDLAVLTHYHRDHAGGLDSLLARVEVDALLLPQLLDSEDQGDLQREVLDLAEDCGIPVQYAQEILTLPLGCAQLTVYPPLSAGSANEEGLAVLCSSGEFDLLITGDMGAATERLLTTAYPLPDIEVLLAGHHGSKYSTSEELLSAVTPEVAVISAGAGNTFGHPAPETLARLEARGLAVYRTDRQGNILIRVWEGASSWQ